ncbi:MAG: tetratricopeptide repeat protein, partial [Planctomycetota bacterium]
CYRNALAVDPHESLAWLWLGQLLVAQGRKAEAEAALANFRKLRDIWDELRSTERELLRRPDDVKALVRVAKARFQLGRYRESLGALDRALEIAPEDEALRRLRDRAAAIATEADVSDEAVTPGR